MNNPASSFGVFDLWDAVVTFSHVQKLEKREGDDDEEKVGLGGWMRKMRFQNICYLQIISMSMKN